MKKQEQIKLNEEVRNIVATRCQPYFEKYPYKIFSRRHFDYPHYIGCINYCNAHLYRVYNGIMLESYDICVAWYDFETGNVYDFLRLARGYDSGSAQHIRKFAKYCNAKRIISYREV